MILLGYNGHTNTYILKGTGKSIVNVSKPELIELIKRHTISNAKLHGNAVVECDLKINIRYIRDDDKDKVISYLSIINNNYDDTDRIYRLLKDGNRLRGLRVGLYGNKYECIFIPRKFGGITIFDSIELPDMQLKIVEYMNILSKQVKNSVFTFQHYCDIPCTFSYVDLQSTIDSGHRYITYFSYITEYSKTLFRDAYERAIFGDIHAFTLEKLTYRCMSTDEYENYIKGIRSKLGYDISISWKDEYNNSSIAGFTYLKSSRISAGKKYLCALYNNKIVGVIHFGIWSDNPYQSVSYIDICKPYRNKGIANELIKKLNNYLDKSLPLVLTELSDLGEKAKMDVAFKTKIKVVKVYSYKEYSSDFKV